jgi:hypothetical protein
MDVAATTVIAKRAGFAEAETKTEEDALLERGA